MYVCEYLSRYVCVCELRSYQKEKIYYTNRTSAARHVERKREMSVVEVWGVGGWWLVIMVTGFGSTAVCCPFARPWWAARWCPRRCSLETHHELIDRRSASVIRCDRSLQDRAQELNTSYRVHLILYWNFVKVCRSSALEVSGFSHTQDKEAI